MIKLIARRCFLSLIAVSLILGVGAITVPAVFAQGEEGTWNIQTVDDVDVISTSLALDSNGYPHIAYTTGGLNSLHYARWTGTDWETEMVDDVSAIVTSMVLDSQNRPHIAYTTIMALSLHYASRTGGGWTTETVNYANVSDCSLALDSQGRPHISYVLPFDAQPLRYAWWTGTDWEFDIVDPICYQGSCSLALDSQDQPHIGYADFVTTDSVHYLCMEGSEWVDEVVDEVGGGAVSIALDSQDVPHISYTTATLLSLHYASRAGGGWTTETVDPVNATDCSLALDSNDRPHISYRVDIGFVDGVAFDGLYASLYGGVGVATVDHTIGSMLKYACLTDSVWDIQEVDQRTITVTGGMMSIFLGASKWSSIALDGNDLPHISYGNLVYAPPAGPGPVPPGCLHYAYIVLPEEEEELPPPSGPGVSPQVPRPLNPTHIVIQFLNVNPEQVYANQSVTITTNAVNTGDEAGNINVALKINGMVEQSRMVSVGPQGTQPVKFTVTKAQPGTYNVDILGEQGSFTILGAGGTDSTAGSNTGALIVLALLGMLVIASMVVLLVRRA